MSIGVEFQRVAQSLAIALPAVAASAYYAVTSSNPALSLGFNIAVGAFLYATRFKPENYADVTKLELDDETLDKVSEIARNIGLKKTPDVYFVDSAITTAGAGARGNNVFLEKGLFNIADNDELEFVVGHECAHILRKDTLLTEASDAVGKIATLNIAGSVFSDHATEIQHLDKPLVFMSALLMGVGLKEFFTRRSAVHEMEYDCDRRSVVAINDTQPAANLLVKLGLCTPEPLKTERYPNCFIRVKALSKLNV